MTNGHPGAGGPYEREGDERAGRTGPAHPRDVWEAPQRPARPQQPAAPHLGQQPWGPELGRGRLDPAWPGPAVRQPVTQPPPGRRPDATGAYDGMFAGPVAGPVAGRDPSWRPNGHQNGHQSGYPNGAAAGAGNGGAHGQRPWPDQAAGWPGQAPPAGQAGTAAYDRYPPVGGFTGHDDPAARQRAWQDQHADVWAPARPEARGWQGGNPAETWGQDLEDPYGAQPGMSRSVRQRVAATGGARVRRVWPQRLVLALVIVAAAIVCWYWLFPILETALPSEF